METENNIKESKKPLPPPSEVIKEGHDPRPNEEINEEAIQREVAAELDAILETRHEDLRTPFLFGLTGVPRMAFLHVVFLLLLGAGSFLFQLTRSVDMKAMKVAMAEKTKYPQAEADIMLWPTIVCLVVAFLLYRRISLRRMVIGIKLSNLQKGFTLSTWDAEDVAIAVRRTWAGAMIAVASFAVFLLAQLFLISFMINTYLKYFV